MRSSNLRQACTLPSASLELFAEIIQKGQITAADHYRLSRALSNNSLDEEEKDSINRLLYSVRRGLLQLVEDY